MTKLRRIEVEALSEQRWSKIERSLFARLERETGASLGFAPTGARSSRQRAWWAMAAAASVAALVAIVLFVRSTPSSGVDMPSRITTGPDTSHLALPGLAMDVEPDSAVVVGPETPQGMLVVVDRGGIVCDVAPRPSGSPLIVQAGATRVRVIGTRFSVSRRGESARVTVSHGIVEVSAHGRAVRVHAGEEWPAKDVAPVGSSADLAPSNAAMPAATGELPPRGSSASERRAPKLSASSPSARVGEEPKPGSAPQSTFEQAAALERRDPARAAQLYGTLESGTDSWARNALYARAQLEAARGNHGRARQLLERYLQRFPRGENAEDARAVLERLR